LMFDSSGTSFAPGTSIMGRWQPGSVPESSLYVDLILADSPTAYWKLDETDAGSLAFDQVAGNLHPMSYAQGVDLVVTGLQSTAVFMGSGAIIGEIAISPGTSASSFRADDFSIEVWVRSNCFTQHDTQPVYAGMRSEWLLIRDPSGHTEFRVTEISGPTERIVGDTIPTTVADDDAFHHIVGVRDQTNSYMSLWIDGVHIESEGIVDSSIRSLAGWMTLGQAERDGAARCCEMRAAFDECAYYPFALSSAQIVEHFERGLINPLRDTGLYYGMEYTSRTASMEISRISIIRGESGQVTTTLSFASVIGSAYFTTPESATEFRFRVQGSQLTSWLNSVEIVRATDSVITGAGESGFSYKHRHEYFAKVLAEDPTLYLRLGEIDGALNAEDLADITHVHTYFDTPTLGSAGLITNDPDTAIRVDGSGQRVNLTNSFDVPLASEITIEFWATASHGGTEASAGFILGEVVGNDICWCTLPWDDEILYFDFGDSTGPGRLSTDYTSFISTKTHVVLYSGGTSGDHQAIWLNAVLVNCKGSSDGPGTILTGGEVCDRSAGFLVDAYKGIMDEFAVYFRELNSATIYDHFLCGVGSCGAAFQGESWDNFDSAPLDVATSTILVQHVPDQWSGRVFRPNSEIIVSALASDSNIIFDWESEDSPSSGFLLLFTDGSSFATIAEGGRFPSSGTGDFVAGDIYDYVRGTEFITATLHFRH